MRDKPRLPKFLRKLLAVGRFYFWLECVVCGREYGGNEAGQFSVPHKTVDGVWVMACKWCTQQDCHAYVSRMDYDIADAWPWKPWQRGS